MRFLYMFPCFHAALVEKLSAETAVFIGPTSGVSAMKIQQLGPECIEIVQSELTPSSSVEFPLEQVWQIDMERSDVNSQ